MRAWVVTVVALGSTLGRTLGAEECPSQCACLASHVDCSRRALSRIPPDLPSWTQTLELQWNGIANLSDSTFPFLPVLKKLDLSHNGLGELEPSFFPSFASVQELNLRGNKLQSLPPAVRQMDNLTHLNLRGNDIGTVDAEALGSLSRLEFLDLGKNELSLWPPLPPRPSVLKELYLDGNRVEWIGVETFAGLESLEILRLSRNRIPALPKDAFRDLRNLAVLDLNRNRIRSIGGVGFGGLGRLRSLRLARNGIRRLEDGAFWGLSALRDLNLRANAVPDLRKGWLYGLSTLEKLTLADNAVESLDPSAWTYVAALQTLDLSNNKLISLPAQAFSLLTQLRILDLSGNGLQRVSNTSFAGLNTLHTLALDGNKLAAVLEDRSQPFLGLQGLRILRLANNGLRALAPKAFTAVGGVNELDLSGNPLASLNQEAFRSLSALTSLSVNSSAVVCDCSVDWVEGWVRESGLELPPESLVCDHPPRMHGRALLTLPSENLTCENSPKPRLTLEPMDVTGLTGANATFVCAAVATSSQDITVQWKRNGQAVYEEAESLEMENRVYEEGGESELTSTLRVWGLRQDDADSEWQCVLGNRFGSVYSRKALLRVLVFPSFLKPPSNVTLGRGQNARLECAALGFPVPQISWKKDGGETFPAAVERRMHVMPSDDVFFIVDTKAEDAGRYTCTASSEAGTVSAHAWITVLEKPGFQSPPSDESTRVGGTAVLKCMAQGSPRPNIRWFHQGRPLTVSPRRELTAENQLLVIVRVEMSDAGLYECEISNELGVRRQETRLSVIDGFTDSAKFGGKDRPVLPPFSGQPDIENTRSKDPFWFFDLSSTPGLVTTVVVGCVVGTSLIWVIFIWICHRRRLRHQSHKVTGPGSDKDVGTLGNANHEQTTTAPLLEPITEHPLLPAPDILNASWAPTGEYATIGYARRAATLDRQLGSDGYSSGGESGRRKRRVTRTPSLRRLQHSLATSPPPPSADEPHLASPHLHRRPLTHLRCDIPAESAEGEPRVATSSLDSGVAEELVCDAAARLWPPSHSPTPREGSRHTTPARSSSPSIPHHTLPPIGVGLRQSPFGPNLV